jgi:hypothetical protein
VTCQFIWTIYQVDHPFPLPHTHTHTHTHNLNKILRVNPPSPFPTLLLLATMQRTKDDIACVHYCWLPAKPNVTFNCLRAAAGHAGLVAWQRLSTSANLIVFLYSYVQMSVSDASTTIYELQILCTAEVNNKYINKFGRITSM